VMETWSEDHPDKSIEARNLPRYRDVVLHGVGYYLRDPAKAGVAHLAYE
jgi:hypothetical protein